MEKEERKEPLKKHKKREMERLRRNGTAKGEPIALRLWQREKEREKRGREQESDRLTAAPNGFSGEREQRGEEERA